MTVGKKIESVDYNRIRNKVIAVLGPGGTNPNTSSADPSFGYGQTLQSSAVTINDKISKSQWDALRWDLYNARFHQTATVPAIQSVTSNSKIQATILDYETFADAAVTNRFTAASANLAPEGGTVSTGASRSQSVSWSNTISCTVTVNFSSSAAARYFFNTGGRIRFSSSFVKTLNNSQNIAWENLLSSVGTQSFGGSTFYTLTSSYATWYTSPPLSTPYGALSYRLQALVNVANNSNGTATQITFRAQWVDGYTDPGPPDPGDLVQGTLSLTASQLRAVGTLQPAGNLFSVAGPTSYSISTIA
jgi:hypothetical protein